MFLMFIGLLYLFFFETVHYLFTDFSTGILSFFLIDLLNSTLIKYFNTFPTRGKFFSELSVSSFSEVPVIHFNS